MRGTWGAFGALLAGVTISCGSGSYTPTQQDIEDSLDATLQSVAGDWIGVSNVPDLVRLEFSLQEGPNGHVSGSGTMTEANAPASVPITVTGTFERPVLTLAFDGMEFESRQVTGTVQGAYTTVGGIATNLTLTAPGYVREVAILLQEK
jgi:hypothetical protein